VLEKYAALVGSAHRGAVTHTGGHRGAAGQGRNASDRKHSKNRT